MAQIPFRANLQSMSFPLLSELSGQTIVVPAQDQTYVGGVSVPATASEGQSNVPADRGIPQAYYLHNVMPSTFGYQSVGYDTVYSEIDWGPEPPTGVNFNTTYLFQGGQILSDRPASTGFKSYISIARQGNNAVFVLDPNTKKWKIASGAPFISPSTVITIATVNGVSYIFFSGVGAFIYDNNSNTLIQRTLSGLDVSATLGLVSSNGYLFTYSKDAVAWSSVVNVEDFVPSDVSGAGGGQVQEARGDIVTATVTSLGLILFTKANAVSCIYSGNTAFPWNFKHISSSGGISSPELVSQEQTGGFQQAYTTNGIQQIGHTGCRTVTPYITDFIAGRIFEDYDTVTNTFTTIEFDWNMKKSLAVIADRYVVISYGLQPTGLMTHALILDLSQNRMGKLKITHNSCFELRSLLPSATEAPRGSIAFLQFDGTIRAVNFNFNKAAPDSVLLLGKYQYVRQRMLELFMIELENVKADADFSVRAVSALDGKNLNTPVEGYLLENAGNYRKYSWDSMIGTNVSLLMEGRFNLITLILWFAPHGRH